MLTKGVIYQHINKFIISFVSASAILQNFADCSNLCQSLPKIQLFFFFLLDVYAFLFSSLIISLLQHYKELAVNHEQVWLGNVCHTSINYFWCLWSYKQTSRVCYNWTERELYQHLLGMYSFSTVFCLVAHSAQSKN